MSVVKSASTLSWLAASLCVLQCVAVFCSVLQHVAGMQRLSAMLQHCRQSHRCVATADNRQILCRDCLQHVATHYKSLQRTQSWLSATRCNTLQITATYSVVIVCNTLQHTTNHCNVLRRDCLHHCHDCLQHMVVIVCSASRLEYSLLHLECLLFQPIEFGCVLVQPLLWLSVADNNVIVCCRQYRQHCVVIVCNTS